jgi:predicted CoA-binding protein
LASKGKLKRVYLLTKTLLSSGFKITPVNLEVIIKHAYLCIIYDLLAPLMQDAIALTSFGFMNVFNDLQKHLEILRKSLKGCELYNVILPRNTNFNKIAVKILSHMADKME